CTCVLRDTATQAVLGNGSTNAKIIFIGEAPGKKEDAQGIPFIGAAGKFLSELLASIHLNREDVYITNVVKYRPPENRDPSPEEINSCREWLMDEIRIINPKIIVTLGRHAMGHFLPDAKISEVHGKLFRENIPALGVRNILPLYHPAAALYNGGLRMTLFQDFKKIRDLLKG
ncbi:MAG: uracil-DNA glycosylase, partial [Candidatus Moraniibacteriota bacterium]